MFLLVANSSDRVSHPQQFRYILFNLDESWMFGFQISRVPYYGMPSVLASSFLLGEICTEKGPGLSIWYYWVLIPRGCPGRDQDLTEKGTVQKQNKNAGHGSASYYVTELLPLLQERHFSSNRDYRDGSFLRKKKKSNRI